MSSQGTKRQRAEAESSSTRSRGATACEKCRSRKTRCNGARPQCEYCTKHDLECIYSEDDISTTFWNASEQILQAINDLSSSISRQQYYCNSCAESIDDHEAGQQWQPARKTQSIRSPNASTANGRGGSVANCSAGHEATPTTSNLAPIRARGLESILEWTPLTAFRTTNSLFTHKGSTDVISDTMPSISFHELKRLALKYIDGVHTKNPVLDLAELQRIIYHVSENGLDWSTRTCLICLVCAIGAATQPYQDSHVSPSGQLTPGAPLTPSVITSETSSENELGQQFWNLASKRLGFAIAQNDLEAVQCLCLAGIWYMHQLQPLEAWKYFNLAGAAWHGVSLIAGPDLLQSMTNVDESARSFTTSQSLYFTIWKSECELRAEIDLPGSILDQVLFPLAFPQPPDLSNTESPENGIAEHERVWYYYLADIAARHLNNRLFRSPRDPLFAENYTASSHGIKDMLADANLCDLQIRDWYDSLPNMFSFQIPSLEEQSILAPHPDDLSQILLFRYLGYKEHVCRPFVRLCIEDSTSSLLSQDWSLRRQVVTRASHSVHYTMLKLSVFAPHRHQGTWYMLRNFTESALILGAVALAKACDWLGAAKEIRLPDDWRFRVLQAMDCMEPFWQEDNGGASEMRLVIQRMLDATAEDGS